MTKCSSHITSALQELWTFLIVYFRVLSWDLASLVWVSRKEFLNIPELKCRRCCRFSIVKQHGIASNLQHVQCRRWTKSCYCDYYRQKSVLWMVVAGQLRVWLTLLRSWWAWQKRLAFDSFAILATRWKIFSYPFRKIFWLNFLYTFIIPHT